MRRCVSAAIALFAFVAILAACQGRDLPVGLVLTPPPTIASSLPPPAILPATPTATRAPTATPAPSHTPTQPPLSPTASPTHVPSPTRTPSPMPTSTPRKPILISFGIYGGDGGTSYDFLYGRDMPSLVLYTDGQLLIGHERYDAKPWYVEKHLTTTQMCALLGKIQATGFFEVAGDGSLCERDPIYRNVEMACTGEGEYIISVNGRPSKRVTISSRLVDSLVRPVKSVYGLLEAYRPGGMTAFHPDRVMLRVQQNPGEDFWEEQPARPGPRWPSSLPSLTALLAAHPEGAEILLAGKEASAVLSLMPLPGASYFTENGETYFVTGRPLLPHESLDKYSAYPYEADTFNLPFRCPE